MEDLPSELAFFVVLVGVPVALGALAGSALRRSVRPRPGPLARAADLGTPHARPSAAGGLLCLEDVGEETYRLDRYLTQLLRAGWLTGVCGILLGSWEDCGSGYDEVRALLGDRAAS